MKNSLTLVIASVATAKRACRASNLLADMGIASPPEPAASAAWRAARNDKDG